MRAEPSLVFGIQPVRQLLADETTVERLAVAKGHHGSGLQEIVDAARAAGIPVRFEDRRQLDRWAEGGTHQGVVAWTAALAYRNADDILKSLTDPAFILVLDGVQDPRNLGALLRTAVAAGVQAVFLPERGAAGLTGTVVKASAGLAAQIPVARVKNLARFIEELKKKLAGGSKKTEKVKKVKRKAKKKSKK